MRIVLDTNVLVSGVFFSGPPFEILNAWRNNKVKLVVSAEIMNEYRRVGQRLAGKYPGVEIGPFLALVAVHGEFVEAPPLNEAVCTDSTDDMFFACAIASGCSIIVSGDKHLHLANGYGGIVVIRARAFFDKYLAQ